MGQSVIKWPWSETLRRWEHHLPRIPAKNVNQNLVMKAHSDKSKWKDILQNNLESSEMPMTWKTDLGWGLFYIEVYLQCWASLCCTVKWLSYTHTFFIVMVYPRRLEYSSLCYTIGPCCLSILNFSLHLPALNALSTPLPLTLPLGHRKAGISVL